MGPTIMIGLGGVGSEIVAMAEQQLFSLPKDSYEKMRPLLQFALVDTDVSALRERKRKGFQGTVVQISDNMTVEKYLHYDPAARKWFPPCQILSKKTMTEGAGQVRAVSRLTLDLELQKQGGFNGLYKAIDRLHLISGRNPKQPTRVVIVSSLSGGTGSGIFLPFAMHLQEYLRRHYINTEPIFKGFFIMPSIFEYVTEGAELRSLNANAYAAIKELNAFTMLQDRQIRTWQYPDLKIELRTGNDQTQTYFKSPYDMCFLFERQNQDDKHLGDFDESKRNVATCVWMQTMNPVLEQNASLEDNLLKIVYTASQDKRFNRFAGMGIAQLVYPYPKIAPYLAMVMADEVVGLNWNAADIAWLAPQREQEEAEWDAEWTEETDAYINFAENRSEWQSLIAPVNQDHWVEKYMAAVEALIKDRFDKNQGETLPQCKKLLESLVRKDNRESWNASRVMYFRDEYEKILQEHESILNKNRGFLKRKLLSGFDPAKKKQKLEEYQIEYWLLPQNGPGTPPENRYFLALTMKVLEKLCKKQEEKIREKKNAEIEIDQIITKLQKEDATKRHWNNYRKDVEKLSTTLNALGEYYYIELSLDIHQELLDMVQALWEAYRTLLREYSAWTESEKASMRKNLVDSFRSKDGQTIRFVCTSEDCLIQMERIVRDSVRNRDYGSSFARELCVEVLKQRNMRQDANADSLKTFWSKQLLEAAGTKLDVDVLTALENEACWSYEKEHHAPLSQEDPRYNEYIKNYMADKAFREIREILSLAFLRVPNIRQRHTLELCIYPPEFSKESVLFQEIVEDHLKKNHGVENNQGDSQAKYHIDFYRAVFGVSAGEVSALLYEEPGSPVLSGEAYLEYIAMIRTLDWKMHSSNFLTPHIDWRWHKTTVMPELSAEYSNRRIHDLLLAVFYGLWSEKIRWRDVTYTIGSLNGQDYSYLEDRIENFYQLVDTLDESPAISAALLDELREDRLKANDDVDLQNARNFSQTVNKAIGEYCHKKLEQESSSDKMATVLARTLLSLVYSLWIEYRCRKPDAALQIVQPRLDAMLSNLDENDEIVRRMKELLEPDEIRQWLLENMVDSV